MAEIECLRLGDDVEWQPPADRSLFYVEGGCSGSGPHPRP